MKKIILNTILSTILCVCGTIVYAADFSHSNQEGIELYYNYINDGKELEVTFNYFNSYNNYKYFANYETIIIPEEVTFMGKTRVVTKIGDYAFLYSPIRKMILPKTLKEIGGMAFTNCYIEELNIPGSVEVFGSSAGCAFSAPTHVKKLIIGEGLKKIDPYGLFVDSIIVKDIKSFLEIEYYYDYFNFFYNQSTFAILLDENGNQLTHIDIPDGFTKIGRKLRGYGNLQFVKIPEGVKEIDDYAFEECVNLSSVNLPMSIEKIGESAFHYCRNIHNIDLPESLIRIGYDAFSGCSLDKIIIPNNVNYIGIYAFKNCNLNAIIIPKNVKSIGSSAFSCDSLLVVTSEIENPEDVPLQKSPNNPFNKNTLMNATLYVPAGTIERYKSTEGWKEFVFIEELQSNGIKKAELDKRNNKRYYDLRGYRFAQPHKGINIEVMSDGTTRKIIEKR